MRRTPADIAEGKKLEARLRFLNAGWHAMEVRSRFGHISPEYAIARSVVDGARAEFVKACDVLADIYAAGGSAEP